MTTSFRFVCELPTGLHARPASVLAETARRFHSAAIITNIATDASAELRSVLSVIGLDIQRGQEAVVEAVGDDAADLIERVRELVAMGFGERADLGAESTGSEGVFVARVPVPVRRSGVRMVPGRPACPGVGEGVVVIPGGLTPPEEPAGDPGASPDQERVRVELAIGGVRADIERELRSVRPGLQTDILRAHLGIIADPAVGQRIAEAIAAGASAPAAVGRAASHFKAKLGASASEYIRERAADVEEVCGRIIGKLVPGASAEPPIALAEESVVVAESLGVGRLMAMDRRRLRALVLGNVGATSHLVILARSLRIPTLIGVAGASATLRPGMRVIVDAFGGFVAVDPPEAAIAYYRREGRARARRLAAQEPLLRRPGSTGDGRSLEVAANAASEPEIVGSMDAGADAIGLLRTELLFLDRAEAPGEEEQYELYRAAVETVGTALASRRGSGPDGGGDVIIRTLDIGGDKPAPYITIPKEDNPFLGCRGVRLYEREPDLLRTQLRAICRASAHGPVRVMAPMVATVGEAKWFCERIARVQGELGEEGAAYDPNMPVGVMVEVPSVAYAVDQLVRVVDFLSIGTNDLCQYFFAADRTNKDVAGLNNPRQPAFLRLLDQIVSRAAAHGCWVGICGEMAGDPANLALMAGLAAAGLSEISVAAPAIGPIKSRLAGLDSGVCREAFERAMASETAQEVDAILTELGGRAGMGVAAGLSEPVHAELVLLDCDARTKDEAIQELVGVLHAAGRTDDPRAVEEAVWAREATYATGMGFGFAIPHCKSDAVACPSISVAKLRAPIDWGSTDGRPVEIVLMLTVRASDAEKTHLKLLAKLSRRLMHEEFREAIMEAKDAGAVLRVLREALELGPA
jgi:fructose-specific PTS system IIA-like component